VFRGANQWKSTRDFEPDNVESLHGSAVLDRPE